MKTTLYTKPFILCLTLLLSACASTAQQKQERDNRKTTMLKYSHEAQATTTPLKLSQLPSTNKVLKKAPTDSKRYSFKARNISLKKALAMFSRANNLNIIPHETMNGTINVQFRNLSFEQAMKALLDPLSLYWEKRNGTIYIQDIHTQTFQVDYIRMARTGVSSSQAQVTSSSTSGQAGSMSISNQDQVNFWQEFDTQLQKLLSKNGRLVIDKLSGTIQVTDQHKHIQEVARFLHSIQGALHRQVEIEARIVEVSLSNDNSLGIDWTRIASSSLLNINTSIQTALTPVGTLPAITATLSGQNNSPTNQVSSIISALKEQGEVNMISQPRLLLLNNQSAMIKVGTEQPFFSQTTTPGTGGSAATVTEDVRVITIGLVLAVTSQISESGWVMLDVSPIITRLVGTATSPLGSTAPILDIKQASTLVRIKDGDSVMIGGLIQDKISEGERKIPLLGDIPFLGSLFTSTYKNKKRTELVIFLTPTIKAGTSLVGGDTPI